MREAFAAFHHLNATAAHELVRRLAMDLDSVEMDRPLAHLAALGMQQIGDRLESGGLAGAVGAE